GRHCSFLLPRLLSAPPAATALYPLSLRDALPIFPPPPPLPPTGLGLLRGLVRPPLPGGPPPERCGGPPTIAPRPPARYGTAAKGDRKSTRLNSSHVKISYAVFCLKKKNRLRPSGK